MKFVAILFFIVFFSIPVVSAAHVSLSTPQSEYYILTGEEAVIPLTIVSTYNHDVTGTLKQTMIPVNSGNAGSGSRGASIQTRAFSAFTETRTVSLSAGKSDAPADYLLTIAFSYDDDGGRTSTLGGIGVHFVTSREDTPANQEALVSTDMAITGTGTSSAGFASAGPAPTGNPQRENPGAALQNNQMPQDASALKNQLANESNQSENERSGDEENELLGYILADPLMASMNRSLTGAGFAPGKTDVIPVSNSSGSFVMTYSSGTKNVGITGEVLGTHVLFAEESSDVPISLPEALLSNTTYQEYGTRIAEKGFVRTQTRINMTPDQETVDLTYSDSQHRILHVKAAIVNGTITSVEGDTPDDLPAYAISAIALICVLLISGGIWYLARFRPRDLPLTSDRVPEPEPIKNPRDIALHLLDEAELDASRGNYPESYRKTGRAIRIVLSHEISHGEELTSGELERLLGSYPGNTGKIRGLLDRCRTVGFAKGTPDPGEFQDMINFTRTLFHEGFGGKEVPGTGNQVPQAGS